MSISDKIQNFCSKSAYGVFSHRLPQGQQETQQRKLLYMGLYLLIWGEASNVRFMPECLCYIFHNVSILSLRSIIFRGIMPFQM